MSDTVNGFDIPLREMTEEELNREVTWERFREFHYAAGEDFLDQTGEGNEKVFGGWLLHKYPNHSAEILDVVNSTFGSCLDFREIEPLDYDEEKDIDKLYIDFAEFTNQTVAQKHRVNTVLIIVTEHYNK